MFAVDGTIKGRRACVLMIARSKEHGRGFRTSYYEHTSASVFNHSIYGKHGNIIMGLVLIFRKVSRFGHCGHGAVGIVARQPHADAVTAFAKKVMERTVDEAADNHLF